jgi:uncharacterized membrane protein
MSEEQQPDSGQAKLPKRDWAPLVLAGIILAVFFSVLEYLLRGEVPDSSRDIVLQMVETLKNVTIMVVSYFVGTTAQGARKTELLGKAEPVKE